MNTFMSEGVYIYMKMDKKNTQETLLSYHSLGKIKFAQPNSYILPYSGSGVHPK